MKAINKQLPFRKFIALLLAIISVTGTTGCGEEDSDIYDDSITQNPGTTKDPFATIPQLDPLDIAGLWYTRNSDKTTEHFIRIGEYGDITFYMFRNGKYSFHSFGSILKLSDSKTYVSFNFFNKGLYDVHSIDSKKGTLNITSIDIDAVYFNKYPEYWSPEVASDIINNLGDKLKWESFSFDYERIDEIQLKNRLTGYPSYEDTFFANAIKHEFSGTCNGNLINVEFRDNYYFDSLLGPVSDRGEYKLIGYNIYLAGNTNIRTKWCDITKPFTHFNVSIVGSSVMHMVSDDGKTYFTLGII